MPLIAPRAPAPVKENLARLTASIMRLRDRRRFAWTGTRQTGTMIAFVRLGRAGEGAAPLSSPSRVRVNAAFWKKLAGFGLGIIFKYSTIWKYLLGIGLLAFVI